MTDIKIKRIPPGQSIKIVKKSWELATVNYPLFLGIFFGFFIASIFLNFIPVVGQIAGYLLGLIFPVFYYAVAKDWESGAPSEFSKVMGIFDNKNIKPLLPYCGVHILGSAAILAIITVFTVLVGFSAFMTSISGFAASGLPPSLFIFIVIVATIYICYVSVMAVALPIVYYNPEVQIFDAIKLAYDGLMINITPLTVLGLILMLIGFLCSMLFVLPVLFVGAPIFLMSHYVVYRMIFEDLEL